MRYKVFSKSIFGIFLLLLFAPTISKAQSTCYVSDTTYSNPSPPLQRGPNASCARNSTVFQNYFKFKENFIPHDGSNLQSTTTKEIKIRAIVVNNSNYTTPQFPNTTAGRSGIKAMLEQWPNGDWASPGVGGLGVLREPTKPNPSNCTNCHIEDSKLRIKLVDIQFINHDSTSYGSIISDLGKFSNDTILNVFLVEHEHNGSQSTDGVNGWAGVGYNFGLSDAPMTSNSIFLAGPYIDSWWASVTFVHELGHIFGLWHLYDFDSGQDECSRIGVGSDDWLTDIFPGSFCINNPDVSITTFCNPYTDTLPLNPTSCTGNYMGKSYNYFSPMQLGRMHRMAYLGSSSRYIYPTEAPDLTPWLITSNQEWDFGIRMYQNIIVKSGNTLTVKCEVQMPPGSKIIVEKGAKLVIDGGHITSYHNKATWQGIELFGDKNAQPYPANQGSFEMKNRGILENANIGVRDFRDNIWHGGGIINVNNSTFKNCWKAIELNDYPNYARGTSCSFSNVHFLSDDAAIPFNSNTPSGQITAFNERGVLVSNCQFENRIALNDISYMQTKGGYAIYTCDAGFRAQNNSFKGYKTGIMTTTVFNHPGRSTRIMNNNFDSLSTGIQFAANFSFVQDNVFDNLIGYSYENGMMAYYRAGEAAFLDHASGITLTRNTVNCTNAWAQRGFTAADTRQYGARIIDNTLNSQYNGMVTQRRNPTLDMLCNHFNGGFANIIVNPQSTSSLFTLKNQGNGCDDYLEYRAGNTFTASTPLHIASFLTTPWQYYYKGDISNQIPSTTSGASLNLTDCTGEEQNSQCDLPSNTESWLEQHFDEAFTQWPTMGIAQQTSTNGLMQLAAIVEQLSLKGSTDSLITFLHAIGSNESKKMLLPLLLEHADYVAFDDVLSQLEWENEEEHLSFDNYYGLLRKLHEEDRQLWQLNEEEGELEQLQTIAAEEFEHSAFAKAWLEFAYGEEWHHYQEQMPYVISSHKFTPDQLAVSRMYDAVPNPAGSSTVIRLQVSEADAAAAQLILRNMMGKIVFRKALQQGDNMISVPLASLPAGIYTYSLFGNGKTLQTKRLAVIK